MGECCARGLQCVCEAAGRGWPLVTATRRRWRGEGRTFYRTDFRIESDTGIREKNSFGHSLDSLPSSALMPCFGLCSRSALRMHETGSRGFPAWRWWQAQSRDRRQMACCPLIEPHEPRHRHDFADLPVSFSPPPLNVHPFSRHLHASQ